MGLRTQCSPTPHCPTLLTTSKTPICCSHSSLTSPCRRQLFLSVSLHPRPCLPIEFSTPRSKRVSKTHFSSCPCPAYSLSMTSHKSFTKPNIYLSHKVLRGKIIVCYPPSGLTFPRRTPLPKHRLVDSWLPALLICLYISFPRSSSSAPGLLLLVPKDMNSLLCIKEYSDCLIDMCHHTTK